jgi:hypothetical protein
LTNHFLRCRPSFRWLSNEDEDRRKQRRVAHQKYDCCLTKEADIGAVPPFAPDPWKEAHTHTSHRPPGSCCPLNTTIATARSAVPTRVEPSPISRSRLFAAHDAWRTITTTQS